LTTTPQFTFIETSLDDVFIVQKTRFEDERGDFIKIFNADAFSSAGLSAGFKESYYSYSHKNVLRGMHYQRYPFGHAKLVSVIEGEILDVCVGIGGMQNARNRGKYFSTVLSKSNNRSLYIPDGYAHGFLVLSERAIVVNHMTSVFNPEHDTGIHYDSFGFKWPIANPLISAKDRNQKKFDRM
jgi:dTDP-4-dehydrorhamnose 3,5-epimerase